MGFITYLAYEYEQNLTAKVSWKISLLVSDSAFQDLLSSWSDASKEGGRIEAIFKCFTKLKRASPFTECSLKCHTVIHPSPTFTAVTHRLQHRPLSQNPDLNLLLSKPHSLLQSSRHLNLSVSRPKGVIYPLSSTAPSNQFLFFFFPSQHSNFLYWAAYNRTPQITLSSALLLSWCV